MRNVDSIAWITLACFVAGLIYYAGRAAARIDALEDWRDEVKDDFKDIKRDLGTLAARFGSHV